MAPSATAAAQERPGTRARDERDGDGRQGDGDKDEAGDGRPIVLEVAERGVIGGIEQHRCDEEREGEIGIEHELRRARQEGQHGAAHGEERGIRRTHAPGRTGEEHRREQENDDPLEHCHRGA